MKIKDATLVPSVTGNQELPVSDGSDSAKKLNINQIKDFISKDLQPKGEYITESELGQQGFTKIFDATPAFLASQQEPPNNVVTQEFYDALKKAVEDKSLLYNIVEGEFVFCLSYVLIEETIVLAFLMGFTNNIIFIDGNLTTLMQSGNFDTQYKRSETKRNIEATYATKAELGNINTILDNINGEVI